MQLVRKEGEMAGRESEGGEVASIEIHPGSEVGKRWIKKEGSNMKSLMRWDPFDVMMRWDPFEELKNMQHEMDRVFGRFLGRRPGSELSETRVWTPTIESSIKEGKMTIKAELPGIEAKDLDLTISDRELVIKGERKSEKGAEEKDYTYTEISYGSFERHLLLPEGAKTESLKAKFSNGVLEIEVPVPSLPKVKKVPIETKDIKQIETEPKVKKAA
jgi:HSP20 family protein